jgi:pyruvate/2-oxoglutarate dehydrogenase complex dihydrolipoamide acyltransferase (E2) component
MSQTTLVDVTLPDVGEGIAEAQIIEWLVAPGQAVSEDQSIVLISTDKAAVELPAPTSGILREQAVQIGATVAVGSLLARIEASEATAEKLSLGELPSKPASQASARIPGISAAPSTRLLARQLRVDMGRLCGSGPNGRILDDDVRKAAAANNAGANVRRQSSESSGSIQDNDNSNDRPVPLSRTRLAIARSTAASWRDVPHITEFRQIDATQLQRAREEHRAGAEQKGGRLTFLPFFIKAVATALDRHPSFNARLDMDREEIIYSRHRNIGIATATEAGLIVPVLRNVEQLSIFEIALALHSLVDRAKRQVVSPSDLTGGSFTITNFGSYGAWMGTPIIRAPEVAIVGFGKVQQAVLAIDGAPAVRPVLPISAATDHRVHDGVHLAAFLDTITESLSNPRMLFADDKGGDTIAR